MARTKRVLIFATFFTSGIAVVLSLVALGTNEWIYGSLSTNERTSYVNYGLFRGVFTRSVSTVVDHSIIMTCSFSKNACAMLCGDSGEERTSELERLINNEDVSFNTLCSQGGSFSSKTEKTLTTFSDDHERQFINAGLWLSTIIFLSISIMFGVVSTALSVWNAATNPVEVWMNIFGLYIYNGIAACCNVMAICLWGAQFGITRNHEVFILDSITNVMTPTWSMLGYSYWLNFGVFLFYGASIIILAVRQHLIDREPEVRMHIEENNDILILF